MYKKRVSHEVKFAAEGKNMDSNKRKFSNVAYNNVLLSPRRRSGKILSPIPGSPIPPPKSVEMAEDVSVYSEINIEEKTKSNLPEREIKKERRTSDGRPSFSGLPDRIPPSRERRLSLSLPRDIPSSALSEKRFSYPTQSERKLTPRFEKRLSLSNGTPSSGRRLSLNLPNEASNEGLAFTFSQESAEDDFVDNLTKQKLNLQLKCVTERMFEVVQ